jgi:excisionase family DNA binding protein
MTMHNVSMSEAADDLLLTSEVASILRVHQESVRRMIREQRLKALRIGREWRIRRRDLNTLLDKGGI